MTQLQFRQFACLAVVAVSVTACGLGTPQNPNAGRYSISQDRAPTGSVDARTIPDLEPQPVSRTLAGNRSPYTVLGRSYTVLPTEQGYRESGVASWYGEKFHGHKTSNGEIFDMYQVSAAHKSLPIPSYARVTNLDNNRSIIVRVNDRGPFHGDRLIDLSYAAALKLGYAQRGTARVQVEGIVADPWQDSRSAGNRPTSQSSAVLTMNSAESSYVQVGAFAQLESAQRLRSELQSMTQRPVIIRTVNSASGVLHRVRIGPVDDPVEIDQLTARVVAARLGRPYTVTE
ncbi:MAG: septal ring lytic transglycosylase RlpA family protein [Pseudohongiellaceae bacterium]